MGPPKPFKPKPSTESSPRSVSPKPSSARESRSNDLSDNLLQELECPICLEYMIPPITMCESGHNICNKCRPRMKKCPNCRQSLLSARNLALENLAKKVKYPCYNRRTGCEEAFPLDEIDKHQSICLHRFYECPLSKAPGILCLWQGPRSDIKKHIDMNHKDRVTEAITKLAVFIREFDPEYKYCRVIYALGDLFYQQFEVKGNDFYFVVQYVGPESEACKYKYEFILTSPDGIEKVIVSHMVGSIKTNINDAYQSDKCVKLHYDIVKTFLQENHLKFEMDISKIEDKEPVVGKLLEV
ncbi:E3 ubiquitin-protein ligase siah-1-like [Periplaneta americana]|uniref:E3 ubiquitin-protein ligase siah-1-like n=1 Tax=Periplaneta americana TaxID=6978 RepID=UPI0037E798A9